jgi:hypothetical protein
LFCRIIFEFLILKSIFFLHLVPKFNSIFLLRWIGFVFLAHKTILFLHLHKISVRSMYHMFVRTGFGTKFRFWFLRLIFNFLTPPKNVFSVFVHTDFQKYIFSASGDNSKILNINKSLASRFCSKKYIFYFEPF